MRLLDAVRGGTATLSLDNEDDAAANPVVDAAANAAAAAAGAVSGAQPPLLPSPLPQPQPPRLNPHQQRAPRRIVVVARNLDSKLQRQTQAQTVSPLEPVRVQVRNAAQRDPFSPFSTYLSCPSP
eukprot:361055-Chlamydomonas_euryale.AAC.1